MPDFFAKGMIQSVWTEQLYREYQKICEYYRVHLRRPLITIQDLGRRWGTWDSSLRKISLHERLIEDHSWDIVLEILKHEMAHQFVEEIYGVKNELHGEVFQNACARLGVAAWAAKATGELPEYIPTLKERSVTVEEERLLRRAEKLLSLATSANEHEALLAMQKVQEIYARFNLERVIEKKKTDPTYIVINRKRKKISQVESMIFNILNQHFFVRVIYTSLYDAKDACSYKVVELLGTGENLQIAEYVYDFLWRKVHQLWEDFQMAERKTRSAKMSYMMGVLTGFNEKLKANLDLSKVASEFNVKSAECRSLIKLHDRHLDDYVRQRFPHLTSRSWGSGLSDPESYHHGIEHGRAINLHKGVNQSSSRERSLLGQGK